MTALPADPIAVRPAPVWCYSLDDGYVHAWPAVPKGGDCAAVCKYTIDMDFLRGSDKGEKCPKCLMIVGESLAALQQQDAQRRLEAARTLMAAEVREQH